MLSLAMLALTGCQSSKTVTSQSQINVEQKKLTNSIKAIKIDSLVVVLQFRTIYNTKDSTTYNIKDSIVYRMQYDSQEELRADSTETINSNISSTDTEDVSQTNIIHVAANKWQIFLQNCGKVFLIVLACLLLFLLIKLKL